MRAEIKFKKSNNSACMRAASHRLIDVTHSLTVFARLSISACFSNSIHLFLHFSPTRRCSATSIDCRQSQSRPLVLALTESERATLRVYTTGYTTGYTLTGGGGSYCPRLFSLLADDMMAARHGTARHSTAHHGA